MENIQALTPEGITGFLAGSAPIEFTGQGRTERYAWIEATLSQQQYFSLSEAADKSSRQTTRLGCRISTSNHGRPAHSDPVMGEGAPYVAPFPDTP